MADTLEVMVQQVWGHGLVGRSVTSFVWNFQIHSMWFRREV